MDPLLAAPPPATRPDAVFRTPLELPHDLAVATRMEAEVRALCTQPLWSDALAQAPETFRATLASRQPALATQAHALQAQRGALFTQAAAVGSTARQLQVRLAAIDDVRRQTEFNACVEQRVRLLPFAHATARLDTGEMRPRGGGRPRPVSAPPVRDAATRGPAPSRG